MTDAYTVYLAGELFDHKHLAGNALLADAIGKSSGGRYTCLVPQDLEQPVGRGVAIRNNDLRAVMECDLGLFHFDGGDIDSGTAVEFLYAKSLDIPAVVFRSDLRVKGDQEGRDPWNLMCSFYPRTETVQLNGMALYKEVTGADGSSDVGARIGAYYSSLATTLVAALDAVRSQAPVFDGTPAELVSLYRWALTYPGGGLEAQASEPGYLEAVIGRKMSRGLI
jgi:nucleoside 2-deoxyribosyltransferase